MGILDFKNQSVRNFRTTTKGEAMMSESKLSMNDLESRFNVEREPLVVLRTSAGRIAVQPAVIKQGPDSKLKPKPLPPGAKHVAMVYGHCRRDVLKAAKAKYARV